jgi:hypothetical protein
MRKSCRFFRLTIFGGMLTPDPGIIAIADKSKTPGILNEEKNELNN